MNTRRRLQGVVTSDKMEKTVVVEIKRSFRHPLYQKVVHSMKHLIAHDELSCDIGDQVQIIETRPISKTKKWAVEKIILKRTERDVPVEVVLEESTLETLGEVEELEDDSE